MSEKIKDTQVSQMQKAIHKVVAIGLDFLSNKISAEDMTHTMVRAVKDYIELAEKEGYPKPQSEEAMELHQILGELYGCGSGYLANRCDADCVARTIQYMVENFSS